MMMLPLNLAGQGSGFPDTVRIPFFPPHDGLFVIPLKTFSGFRAEGSISSGLFNANNETSGSNNGYLFTSENLSLQWKVERPGVFALLTTFTHRLGGEWWLDSIASINLDENLLKCNLEWKPFEFAGIKIDSELSTCLFNDYGPDHECRASFLTPLIWNLVSGISFTVPDVFILAGINGLRMIYLHDPKIVSSFSGRSLYNMPGDRNYVFDYGLQLQVRLNKTILKLLKWDFEFLGFKYTGQPAGFSLRNRFGFHWNKILVTSLDTQISYDKRLGPKVKWENRLTMGVAFIMNR